MLLRKSFLFLVSFGLLAACSSTQENSRGGDVANGLSRVEAQEEWTGQVGALWETLKLTESPENLGTYWLTPESFSSVLLNNRYVSQVKESYGLSRFSRNFCGSTSYAELIADEVGVDENEVRKASTFGMRNFFPDNASDDAMLVEMEMVAFQLSPSVSWDEVGSNLFRKMQDQIASQTSGRCRFSMRGFLKEGASYPKEPSLFTWWWTEQDLVCSKRPCLGWPKQLETELSEFNNVLDSPPYFFLLQANLTGRPFVRTVFFMPRPEQGLLLMLEVASIRKGYTNKRISGDLAEQHARMAKDLFTAWEKRSSIFSNRDELVDLYNAAQPVSQDFFQQIRTAQEN